MVYFLDILKDKDVSLSHGIELQLDIEAETLSFWLHNTNQRLCTINNVHGKEIYPFYLFLDDGYFPVEIEYLEGPKGENTRQRQGVEPVLS